MHAWGIDWGTKKFEEWLSWTVLAILELQIESKHGIETSKYLHSWTSILEILDSKMQSAGPGVQPFLLEL